tara:strand:+ start:602 stop:829 length:228 start_codon:yes stop_codon:yes gene_type:complete
MTQKQKHVAMMIKLIDNKGTINRPFVEEPTIKLARYYDYLIEVLEHIENNPLRREEVNTIHTDLNILTIEIALRN